MASFPLGPGNWSVVTTLLVRARELDDTATLACGLRDGTSYPGATDDAIDIAYIVAGYFPADIERVTLTGLAVLPAGGPVTVECRKTNFFAGANVTINSLVAVRVGEVERFTVRAEPPSVVGDSVAFAVPALDLSAKETSALGKIANSDLAPESVQERAKSILLLDQGGSSDEVAQQLFLPPKTVKNLAAKVKTKKGLEKETDDLLSDLEKYCKGLPPEVRKLVPACQNLGAIQGGLGEQSSH